MSCFYRSLKRLAAARSEHRVERATAYAAQGHGGLRRDQRFDQAYDLLPRLCVLDLRKGAIEFGTFIR